MYQECENLYCLLFMKQFKRRCIRKKRGESTDRRMDNWPNVVHYWYICFFFL